MSPGALPRAVVGGGAVAPAVALVSIVTRLSDGGGFKVRRGPSSAQALAMGLQIVNCSRSSEGETRCGDVMAFMQHEALETAWWMEF
jgi:hypothetical protein